MVRRLGDISPRSTTFHLRPAAVPSPIRGPFCGIFWTPSQHHVSHISGSVEGNDPACSAVTRGRYHMKTLPSLCAALILVLSLTVHRVQAQTAPLPQLQSADPFMADLFHRSRSTGMVVVVVRDHETWMQSYGQTYPGSHQKPNADSLIRLCSLTKIMTTDVLVKLVADGRVSLSDP